MKTFVYLENSNYPNNQNLDIYIPKDRTNDEKLPCIIYLFGGGFRRGSKLNVHNKPQAFIENNLIFISINYRLSPSEEHEMQAKHPDHVEDVASAIFWVKNNIHKFGGDPERIFLMGHSSGAHLAALVSTNKLYLHKYNLGLETIKGTICLDIGSYDLLWLYQNSPPFFCKILENAFGKDYTILEEASPIKYITKDEKIPPFLLTYTTIEAAEPNEKFANLLVKNGFKALIINCTSQDHFSIDREIGLPENKLTEEIFKFIRSV